MDPLLALPQVSRDPATGNLHLTDLSDVQKTIALPSIRLYLGTYTVAMPSKALSLIPRSSITPG